MPVTGYMGVRGNFSGFEWSADSRFVLAIRAGSLDDGLELIDSALGKRASHVTYPNEKASFSARFAPAGYYYSHSYRLSDGKSARPLSRVLADGSSAPLEPLLHITGVEQFDATGRRLYYPVNLGNGTQLAIVDLPDRTRAQAISEGSENFDGYFALYPDANSVIARVEQVGATLVYKRIYFDGRASEIVSKPGENVKLAMASRSQRYYLFEYESSVELVDISNSRRAALPTANMRDSTGNFTIGFAAEQPYYQAADGLHFASIDDTGALLDRTFETGSTTEVCRTTLDPVPQNKAVFRLDAGRELVFVDFSAGEARVAGRIARSTDSASLSCPQWEHSGNALGFNEQRGTASAYYLVDWSKATLGDPVLVLTSQARISTHGFMLR